MNIIISEITESKKKLYKDKIPHFIFIIYILSVLVLCGIIFINHEFNISYEILTRDPSATFNAHPFVGLLSNIGILIWSFTAAICAFSAVILFKINDKSHALFFLSSGMFTCILLIDDFFMFHEYLFKTFKDFKIAEPVTISIYGFFMIWYFFKFYTIILTNLYMFLGLALAFFGLSICVDIFLSRSDLITLIEDVFKFIGLINWMLFFSITSYQILINKLQSKI